MAIRIEKGNHETLVPEIVRASPLHVINSTAYACKVEYKYEDSLSSAVVLCAKEEGAPMPTKVTEAMLDISEENDIEPHFCMEWCNRKIQTPGKNRPRSTEVSIADKII